MVLSHDPDEIFYQKIIRYLERTLRSKDYACYFSYTEDDPKQASELIDEMGERFISGCVVFQKDKEVFTEENLEKYLKQANALKYSKASTENARKAKLLELLNGLLADLIKRTSTAIPSFILNPLHANSSNTALFNSII